MPFQTARGIRRSEPKVGGGAGEAGQQELGPQWAERHKGRARRMGVERERSLMPESAAARKRPLVKSALIRDSYLAPSWGSTLRAASPLRARHSIFAVLEKLSIAPLRQNDKRGRTLFKKARKRSFLDNAGPCGRCLFAFQMICKGKISLISSPTLARSPSRPPSPCRSSGWSSASSL